MTTYNPKLPAEYLTLVAQIDDEMEQSTDNRDARIFELIALRLLVEDIKSNPLLAEKLIADFETESLS